MTRVVVTGAGAGIGRAIASAFAAGGGRVHACDVDAARLDRLGAELPGVSATVADVADPAQVERLFADAAGALGGLDVLVNNAGVSGPTAGVADVDPADWDRTLAVDLTGPFLCIRAAVPLLRAAGSGAIVNIASTAGMLGYPLRAPYAAAKWGLVGLTKTLAMELGPEGIRVNAVAPGSIAGERMDRVIAAEAAATGRDPDDVKAGYVAQTSLRTFVAPEEIASAVVFLCSPEARSITGQVLGVDANSETLRTG